MRDDFEGERFDGANEELTERSIRVMQLHVDDEAGAHHVRQHRHGDRDLVGGMQAIDGELTVGQDRGVHQLPAHHDDAAGHDDDALERLGAGIASAQAHRRSVRHRARRAGRAGCDARCRRDAQPRVTFEQRVVSPTTANRSESVLPTFTLARRARARRSRSWARPAPASRRWSISSRASTTRRAGAVNVAGDDVTSAITQDSLLAQVGIVPQEAILFSGTVRDNIRYGQPDASDDEVMAAAQAAQAHEFISRLPQGYDTHVEQRGANLSGGQKQRIAIARALLLRPRILILDDSTSAVDVETETKIQDALDSACAASARRSSWRSASARCLKADKIIVLDEGRIVAEGTHRELMASSPMYREIYDSQLGGGVAMDEPSPNGNGTANVEVARA